MRFLWPLPITLFGAVLGIIVMTCGGTFRREGIALEGSGGPAAGILWLFNPRSRIEAITLGHVIIARDAAVANALRSHEHAHVRQYERWGLVFPLVYLAAGAWARMHGGCAYRDNCFEREARAAAAR